MPYLGNRPTATPIQSSDLADGIVTNAKLGTDISAAKLTAGTLPDARFPATLPALNGSNLTNISGGKVLKVQQTSAEVDSYTSSASYSTFKTVSFTPTSASSTIYFFANYGYQLYGNNSSQNADGKFNVTSEATGSSVVVCENAFTMVSIGNSNTFYHEMCGSCSGKQASQGTSAFDVTLRIATRGTGRMRVFDSTGDNTNPTQLTIMEIAN